ncbi:C2 calcium-dependent membrane targeting [Artemisia annua]|uniref:C2 calcium-dependent membrane targeting n=1 Tax=Artemisia annua TaxID=35608 RepID=A0A2U1N887_ARTAN|nr:C2 calcium-dependent membrane targeting [Artemisia annua]
MSSLIQSWNTYRILELSIISAEGLKKPNSGNKSDQVYAIAYIAGKLDRFRTPVDKKGGSEPTWNHQPMKFTINEAEALRNSLMLVIKLKAERMFFDKNLGEVRLPIKELMEGIRYEGKRIQVVGYQVQRKSNEPSGSLRFSYTFGKKFLTPVYYRPAGASSIIFYISWTKVDKSWKLFLDAMKGVSHIL